MRTTIKHIKSSHPLKNITRRDASFHGWEFQKSINNRKLSTIFKDSDYNHNPAEALAAAILYRDAIAMAPEIKEYRHMGVMTYQDFKRVFA